MQPAQLLLGVALGVAALAACSQRRTFDHTKVIVEEVGESQLHSIVKVPTRMGEITTWRTTFPGQVFAAVKTQAPCPRDIHSVAGALPEKDRIVLCFSATARDEPVPGFACSEDVYLKYEVMRVPADVEPKFEYIGACPGQPVPARQGVSP